MRGHSFFVPGIVRLYGPLKEKGRPEAMRAIATRLGLLLIFLPPILIGGELQRNYRDGAQYE